MIQRFRQLSMRSKVIAIVVVVLAGSGVVLGAVRLGKRTPTVPTYEVKRGEFLDSLQFRGEVKALKSVTISSPSEAGDLQIIKIAPEGTAVKPGDMIVEFDKTKTEQDLLQDKSALKSAEAGIEQARAQARLSEEEDKTTVLKARYDVEAAKLEASKQEIVSKIEGEEAQLKLNDAEQKLKETEVKLNSDKTSDASDIQSKGQKHDQAQFKVRQTERSLSVLELKTPIDGIVTLLINMRASGFSGN